MYFIKKEWYISNKNKLDKIKSKKIIVCNGLVNDLVPNILPVYYGVGSAFEINDKFSKFGHLPKEL